MDKNGNGTPAQFSPEELIRRLKSQLNINSDDGAEEKPAKASEVEEIAVKADDAVESAVADEAASEPNDETASEPVEAPVTEDEIVDTDDIDENDEVAEEVSADEPMVEVEAEAKGEIIIAEAEENDTATDEAQHGETVEFSISDLFGGDEKHTDSAVEVDVAEVEVAEPVVEETSSETVNNAESDKNDEDLDFLSFLTGSGISTDAIDNEPVDDASDSTGLSFEEVSFDTEAIEDAAEAAHDTVAAPAAEDVSENEDESQEISVDDSSAVEGELSFDVELGEDVAVTAVEEAVEEPEETDYSFDSDSASEADSPSDGKPAPDFNMLIALGIPVAEVEKIYGPEAAAEYAGMVEGEGMVADEDMDEEEYEYSSKAQNDEINENLTREKKLSLVKLAASAILFILALLFENLPALGTDYSGWMNQAAFPVVHIMVDLQLVLVAAVLAADELIAGVKALIRRSANVGTVLAVALLINVIYDIALCFTETAKFDAKLSGASVIFAVMLCLLTTALRLITEIKAFRMVSASGTKCCALTQSKDDAKERSAFFDKIPADDAAKAKVISFDNSSFIGGFFAQQNSEKATVIDKILAPAAFIIAIIALVIAYATSKDFGTALYVFNCAAAFLLPVSVFAAGAFTYATACNYAESMKSCIIGENTPYDYADSSIVAFDDKDAYPSYCVKLRNLKVYGSIAIVDVLRMTATVFRKIGGPLNDVLETATSELNKDAPVDIVRSCEAGIEAVYEGKRLLVGKADFLHSYGIIPYSDVDDREYLKTGDVSIMYVAVEDELCAKFYVQYTLDVEFEVLLRDLNRAGICVSIRTSDPNIDKRLLQAKLNLNKASLRIVYRDPVEGRGAVKEELVSGVIGTGTPSDVVHTAMLCDRVVHVYRTNNIVKALSLAVGVALLIIFAIVSANLNIFSALLILYQIFWMIPTLIVSKLFL